MSSTSSAPSNPKKRDRADAESPSETDSSKRAKLVDNHAPTSSAPQQAPTGSQSYPLNYSSQAYGQYAQTGTGGYEYGYQYPYAYYNAPGGHYGQYQAAYSQTAYHAPYASSSGVSHAPIDPSIDPLAYPGEKKGAENGQDSAEAKEAEKAKKTTRYAAGRVWEDTSMADWPENDFRIYVGNLGEEVDDKTLHDAFSSFPSLARWRVVRDKKYDLTKGFGFVSFLDPREGVKALKTMNGRYIGSRPCKLTKSTHDKRAYHKKK